MSALTISRRTPQKQLLPAVLPRCQETGTASDSNSGPDMRAYNSWELHLNKTGGPGQPSSSCPVLPPPYNFRTAFCGRACFPEDKTFAASALYHSFSALRFHRGAAEGGGVFAAARIVQGKEDEGTETQR